MFLSCECKCLVSYCCRPDSCHLAVGMSSGPIGVCQNQKMGFGGLDSSVLSLGLYYDPRITHYSVVDCRYAKLFRYLHNLYMNVHVAYL